MSDLNKEKFEFLSSLESLYSSNLLSHPLRLLEHSIINTIELSELVKIYINEFDGNKLFERNIIKRLYEDKNKIRIYDYIFDALKQTDYINRLRLRKIMESIISCLDDNYKFEFFSYFYKSKYVYEIRAALKMVELIWDSTTQEMLLNDYYNTLSLDILTILVSKVDNWYILELAKTAWKHGLPKSIKYRFIKRLKGSTIATLGFLRADPGNFLYLFRYSNEQLTDHKLLDCYNRIPESYKPFAIWNLGKMGNV